MSVSVFSSDQFSQLVSERIAALRSLRLDFTRSAPRWAPHHFSESIGILIETIDGLFASRRRTIHEQAASAEEKSKEIHFAAQWCVQLLNNVQEQYFPFLEKFASPHIPLPILPAMQRIASQFQEDVELYLFPTSEHNFGFSGFRNLVKAFVEGFEIAIPDDIRADLEKEAASLPSWFVFLSLPYVTHASALNLTPLLHELGHFVDFRLEIFKEVLPLDISQSEAARDLIEKICQTRIAPGEAQPKPEEKNLGPQEPRVGEFLGREFIEQQVFAQCEQVVRSWVHELIADLFALRLAGPAYFYGFVNYAANIGLDTKSAASHPSPAIRVDLMLKELEDLDYLTKYSPDNVRSSLQLWQEWASHEKLEPDEALMRVAYLSVNANIGKLKNAVRTHTAPFSYPTKTYVEKVPRVVSDLGEGIPPVDRPHAQKGRFQPCEFADILNGAWSTYMFSLEKVEQLLESPSGEKRRLAVKTLNELVLKAIESSEIVRGWESSKQEKL